ncbi:hypothetical protein EAb13_CDS0065 [Acinetobacter phage EAb13]|nr:hypothetical protein EAb13_CDS0065 [Acinetobacter phage EAb13]
MIQIKTVGVRLPVSDPIFTVDNFGRFYNKGRNFEGHKLSTVNVGNNVYWVSYQTDVNESA